MTLKLATLIFNQVHPSSRILQFFTHDGFAMASGSCDMLDDIRLLTLIKEGDLDGVLCITSNWGPKDYHRLHETNVFPLHLATCFGHHSLVQHFCSLVGIDINQRDQNGSTALHLAASQGQYNIVQLLLGHPDINDTVLDNDNKDPLARAQTEDISAAIYDARLSFTGKSTQELSELLSAKDFEPLKRFYSNPRVRNLVDINLRDALTGRTFLHEAALSNNEEAVTWLIKLGANIVVRDNDGELPYDLATEPKVKELLSEVHIGPGNTCTRLEGTLKKWTNLASGFKERYFVLEDGCLSYFKSQFDIDTVCRGSILMKAAQINWKEGSTWFEVASHGSVRYELKASHIVEAKKWVAALLEAKEIYSTKENPITEQNQSLHTMGSWSKPKVSHLLRNTLYNSVHRKRTSMASVHSFKLDEYGTYSMHPVYSDSPSVAPSTVANDDRSLKATLMSIGTHSDVQLRLLQTLQVPESSDDAQNENPEEALKTLRESILSQKSMISDAAQLHAAREDHWARLHSQQQEKEALWRSNLEALAKEHQDLQDLLRSQSFKRKSRTKSACEDAEMTISDDEEDFFDADDGLNTQLANSVLELSNTLSPTLPKSPLIETDAHHDITASFLGYPADGRFRSQLEMPGDKHAEVSLWSILKNSVGKDLSRIAVPVEFNEPTSMLQRMCEDMEYSGLIDMAVQQPDSLERMLWVAAFAMSNYSSTSGRTGKPFNPLLGETFEYVRADRGYRYISEQVSHHPPISACYAESPNYIFQAEVNLVSKFWGKSFELNPKGVTHLFLRLPKHDGGEAESISSSGCVEEHYSWTKVTSAMNNIIIGTMYIEHYGDMVIKNHNTGESCALTFHRTGWRSSNQHVIRGMVHDANGREVWELGGRWDDKLVARRVGMHGGGDLLKEGEASLDHSTGGGARPILLWKMTPPPDPKIAYNLTQFAVSLNELPDPLLPHLPPTDSRHRPDQKAMERGDFSAANLLKVELETRQRQRSKANGFKPHAPRWFSRDTDPDTGTPMWSFNHQYWSERSRCGNAHVKGEAAEWNDVPHIFE